MAQLGRNWPDFNANKAQVFSVDLSSNCSAFDIKMDGCVLDEKPPSKIMGFSFSSRLNWCSHIDAIAKTASIEALSCFMKFLSSEVALYFHRSVIRPCIDYSCHIWAGA